MQWSISSISNGFPFPVVAEGGDSIVYQIAGGVMPGMRGSGSDDRYQAIRTDEGWESRLVSAGAAESEVPGLGGISADHGYSFLHTKAQGIPDNGTLNQRAGRGPDFSSSWMRYPDGTFEPIGRGSLGVDHNATGHYISPGAEHTIFSTVRVGPAGVPQLEPEAPADAVAIYDRVADGTTHVVSLLPGDATPSAAARYQGVSANGTTVLFQIGDALYVRVNNQQTKLVVDGGDWVPAGTTDDGSTVFYTKDGDAFAFDTATEATDQLTSSGDVELATISADGSHVYFVSWTVLTGTQTNHFGATAQAGEPNLYVETNAGTRFIATVAPSDVNGTPGLTAWTSDVVVPTPDNIRGPGNSTARTTPNGRYMVFASAARLDPTYDNESHVEIYRYDAATETLVCVSCRPDGGPPDGDAKLQSVATLAPTGPYPLVQIPSITDDGGTVVFESFDSLMPRDTNGQQDVYRWLAGGTEHCSKGGGCIDLISSGTSTLPSYLYGMSRTGRDIVFATNDTLVPQDHNDGAGSLYDARVGGGFKPEEPPQSCVEDDCQGEPTVPPTEPSIGSDDYDGSGNVPAPTRTSLQVGQARLASTKVARIHVTVPSAGRLVVAGKGIKRAARRLNRAGHHVITLSLTRKARKAVARRKPVRLSLRVKFHQRGDRSLTTQVAIRVAPRRRAMSARNRRRG